MLCENPDKIDLVAFQDHVFEDEILFFMDPFQMLVQCVTIENRQSPFYVVNRVTLTGKTTLDIILVPLIYNIYVKEA